MNYRKEKLRRHWMDRPPLPTSPVPCDDILMAWGFGDVRYSEVKPESERRMDAYDDMPRAKRDIWKETDSP